MTDKVSSKSLQGKCLTFYPFAGFFFFCTHLALRLQPPVVKKNCWVLACC